MSTPSNETPQAPIPETTRISLTGQPLSYPVSAREAAADVDVQMIRALRPGTALLFAPTGPTAGARYLLDEESVTVGRAPEADIVLDDVTVSRHHARFEVNGQGGYRLVDLRSTNGTYLNGTETDGADLVEGDVVQIGKYRLTYHPAQTAQA